MNHRLTAISIILVLLTLLIGVRLYFVQIVHGSLYENDAKRQYINKNTIEYDRGEIYFESKEGELVPAAISRTGYTLSINPKILKDSEEVYSKISNIIQIDRDNFVSKIQKKEDEHEEIANRLNQETAERIKKLNLYGLDISTEKWRFYPGGKVAAQTLGFIGYKDNELAGRYGLERQYEDTLRKDPDAAYNNFFAEFFSNVKESLSENPKQSGSIITTIEPSVEMFLEAELQSIVQKWGSDSAGGLIVNPLTGAITAIASTPSFDLNNFKEASVGDFKNPIVENVYEMGSIFKPLTMAAGLDAGKVAPETIYYDAGSLTLNKKTISNYDGRARGSVSMQEVLNQSLNTGAAYVALKLGNEKFAEYMKNFGIGIETGIDLPNEAVGLVDNLDSTRDIEIVTASYGQGVAVTPIAMVRALSVLANGGVLVTPHLVKKIEYDNGLSKKVTYDVGKRVISEEASKKITEMLVRVVDTSLRNGTAKIPGYKIAAKTGTAQMTVEGVGGYSEGKYLHSFFGYFPADKPEYLVFLFHTYPKNVRYASETLTDPFLNITKFLINYYQIPPDRPEETLTKQGL